MVTTAHAENWKSLGEGFYVDVDSAKKRGDIGNVDAKYQGEFSVASFDCKRRMYIPTTGNEIAVRESGPVAEMLKIACTKWYEVWKR